MPRAPPETGWRRPPRGGPCRGGRGMPLHLLTLVQAQQPVVHEDAGESVAMARCTSAAATAESTPPDRPQIAAGSAPPACGSAPTSCSMKWPGVQSGVQPQIATGNCGGSPRPAAYGPPRGGTAHRKCAGLVLHSGDRSVGARGGHVELRGGWSILSPWLAHTVMHVCGSKPLEQAPRPLPDHHHRRANRTPARATVAPSRLTGAPPAASRSRCPAPARRAPGAADPAVGRRDRIRVGPAGQDDPFGSNCWTNARSVPRAAGLDLAIHCAPRARGARSLRELRAVVEDQDLVHDPLDTGRGLEHLDRAAGRERPRAGRAT